MVYTIFLKHFFTICYKAEGMLSICVGNMNSQVITKSFLCKGICYKKVDNASSVLSCWEGGVV